MRIPLRRSQSEACALLVHDRRHERLLSVDRLDLRARRRSQRCGISRQDTKEGINYFQHAMAADPRAAVIHKDMGVAHVQLSAFDDAIADFQAALALDR